ncbi:hypothetical protein JCM3775_005319 [Rhodotorula graminis]|uniref:Copper transport protein n=1 Tax=Rhodotorula graminis (strain WP1) TaxID=578459 RepID=A0A0P9EJY2_RHOGW|nr:uncharacterized protein RHOBADRAFT_54515 [Rhodotorula graminis WP1]KPV73930.1 hypothetical protein RHOBADRAFT_54515 [Rhodotorula graminis WP1]
MDHGGHMGSGHHMPDHHGAIPCKMAMLGNTDPIGICLVFPSMQITSSATLVFYLALLILLSMATEYLRLSLATFDRALRSNIRGGGLAALSGDSAPESSPVLGASRRGSRINVPSRRGSAVGPLMVEGADEALLGGGGGAGGGGVGGSRIAPRYWGVVRLPWFVQLRRSAGYALHVALTFYIMLLVMSYNLQIVGAIILGAFLGHFVFHRGIDLGAGAGDEDQKGLQCH